MMRQVIPWIALLALGLFGALPVLGQDEPVADTSDLEGWTAVELEYKIDKRWTVSIEEQLRLKSDVSEVDRYFTQLGLGLNARHGFSFDGGLRFIRRNDTEGNIQGYESQRRYHVSASWRHKPGRWTLGYRVRYQAKRDVETDEFTVTDRHLRLRARARYNIRKWKLDPVVSAELYRPVGDGAMSDFDKLRFTLGSDLDAWNLGELGVFYRIEKELNVDVPRTTHIIGLKFTHTLK